MPYRYFLQVAYLGTHYHGWQIQENAITVQGLLQDCLACLLQQEVKLVGSGRTDAGVHARMQYAHMDLARALDVGQVKHRLNRMLPSDIAIKAILPVRPTAHARFDALWRTYEYVIAYHKDPFTSATSYHYKLPLDVSKMNQVAYLVKQQRDFEAFSKTHTQVNNFHCTIQEANWRDEKDQLVFRVRANRFLRGMVRIMVSSLLAIGNGQLRPMKLYAHIQRNTLKEQVALVPARGLTLMDVQYPEELFVC